MGPGISAYPKPDGLKSVGVLGAATAVLATNAGGL